MDELPLPWPEFREVWRPLPGFEGYDVSSNGRMRSWRRYGRTFATTPRPLNPWADAAGYARSLCVRDDGKRITVKVHRAIAQAFFGEQHLKSFSCHIDGIKAANTVNNLYWGDRYDNQKDIARHAAAKPKPPRSNTAFRPAKPVSPTAIPLPWPEDREVWRPVPGFDGYDVSCYGRVRSWRAVGRRSGRLSEPRIVDGFCRAGYPHVCVRHNDGRRLWSRVHRLVLLAFVGPASTGMECRHLDGASDRNDINNLCWGTSKENKGDIFRYRPHRDADMPKGEANTNARLRVTDIPAIRARLLRGDSQRSIARDFGVSVKSIWMIHHGVTWSHVA